MKYLIKSKLKETSIKKALELNYAFTVRKIRKLSGFYDANFRLETNQGSYFLKLYGYDKLPSITFQIALIETLYNSGLPVGKIKNTKDDGKYFAFRQTFGIVQEFLKGNHLKDSKINLKLMENLGQTLGRIHTTTSHAKFKGKKWKKYPWDLAQFHIVAGHLSKVKKYLAPEVYTLSKGVISLWRDNSKDLEVLRKGVVHNDFHGKNLLIQKNRLVGITDFGDSIYSWFAADVAVALAHICFINHKKILSASRAFLKGYFKTFGLTDAEKEYLQLLVQMRACLLIVELTYFFRGKIIIFYRKFFKDSVYILKFFRSPENRKAYFELYKKW